MPDAALDGGDERRDLGAEIAAVEAVLVSPDVSKLNAGCDDKGGGEGVERSLPLDRPGSRVGSMQRGN